eukprot:20635-Heterococcus_DN1.PRE.7
MALTLTLTPVLAGAAVLPPPKNITGPCDLGAAAIFVALPLSERVLPGKNAAAKESKRKAIKVFMRVIGGDAFNQIEQVLSLINKLVPYTQKVAMKERQKPRLLLLLVVACASSRARAWRPKRKASTGTDKAPNKVSTKQRAQKMAQEAKEVNSACSKSAPATLHAHKQTSRRTLNVVHNGSARSHIVACAWAHVVPACHIVSSQLDYGLADV